MGVPFEVGVEQLQSLRSERRPPFPLLGRLDADEVRQVVLSAFVSGNSKTSMDYYYGKENGDRN